MTTQNTTGAGGFDWLAVWRQMYEAEREQAERIPLPDAARAADHWAGQSDRFAAAVRRNAQPDHFMEFVLPQLRPSDCVVDIGAGTGRYVPPLARTVARVVAIEPSPSMREHLEQRVRDELAGGTPGNVEVRAETWPQTTLEACDVAICAHVVYAVRDIAPFLQRMYAVARRACFLYVALRHAAHFISPFWESVHGEPRLRLPGALECLNAAHQIGIPAQLTLLPVSNHFRFADEQEALADIRWRLRLPADPVSDARLMNLIDTLLERDAEGGLAPPGQPTHTAVIWWTQNVA